MTDELFICLTGAVAERLAFERRLLVETLRIIRFVKMMDSGVNVNGQMPVQLQRRQRPYGPSRTCVVSDAACIIETRREVSDERCARGW